MYILVCQSIQSVDSALGLKIPVRDHFRFAHGLICMVMDKFDLLSLWNLQVETCSHGI